MHGLPQREHPANQGSVEPVFVIRQIMVTGTCLLYTSDAADERSSVDLGGRRIIKKKKKVGQEDAERQ